MAKILAAQRVGHDQQIISGQELGMGGGLVVPPSGNVSRFLLYDQFDTDRAAGAVNGTPSEPGLHVLTGAPPTRVVVDGNGVLSISGGKLSLSTGGVGAGNPALWYSSIARAFGRTFIATIVPGAGTIDTAGGWDTDQTGAAVATARLTSITQLRSGNTLGASPVVGAYTAGVSYEIAVIHRATGAYIFIKGGTEFPLWTLIWIDNTISTSPLFPFAGSFGGTTAVATFDNIRVPEDLISPIPLAYDTFTRADGALGSTETTGPDSQTTPSLAWQFTTGIWAVLGNKAVATPTLGGDVVVNGGFGVDANWNKGTGWSIGAGVASHTGATGDLNAAVAPLTAGLWYKVVYTVSAYVSGTANAINFSYTPTHNANGTYADYGRAGTTGFGIRGNSLEGSVDNVSAQPLATADLFSSVQASTADVIAEVSITLADILNGVPAGLVLNLDSVSNPQNYVCLFIGLVTQGAALQAFGFKVVSGTFTNIAGFNASITYSAGAAIRAIKRGTEYRLYYNGSLVGSAQTISDATVISNTLHGAFSPSPLTQLDNFMLIASGSGNEYARLGQYQ